MSPRLLGLGTVVPERHLAQAEAARRAAAAVGAGPRETRVLETLYRRNGVRRRHYAPVVNGRESLIDRLRDGVSPPTTGERMQCYAAAAAALAEPASRRALDAAGVVGSAITHLLTVSCTGFAAPGVDIELIRRLDLSRRVERTHVGFMGCHGALNALRVAAAITAADTEAVALVCAVELCSLHFAHDRRSDRVVANSLFADGAAAAVVAAAGTTDGPRIATGRGASCLVPDTEALMAWRIGDHGFEMTLSPRVPRQLEGAVRPWLEDWLAGHGLRTTDIASWAIHPGGPRVLEQVARGLDITPDSLAASRTVLAEYGNMSSPTVMFILQRLLAAGAAMPCVALGFGPGLAAEAVLLR